MTNIAYDFDPLGVRAITNPLRGPEFRIANKGSGIPWKSDASDLWVGSEK
ncbi:hypothetical protein G5B38_02405 [Pseudohalocynthiibacter aestuariivivens]|nr:hypothetical protein [Pseudohalocynthiibacter aestuariivivens]QIE44470.1 hypothetical protein G5B38_02405 [Pseudohalocynthiibacter aestuariivivens]